MAAELQHFDATKDDWDDIIANINKDGGVIVENFMSEDLHHRIMQELKPHADGFEPGMDGGMMKQIFCGAQTKRFAGVLTKAPSFVDVVDNDLLHQWAEESFENDYWLNTAQAMIVGPGSVPQFLHRDAGNWPISMALGKDGPEATLSIMMALTDFTKENGATRVVPGSHLWDDYDVEATEDQVTQAVMPARSALLYTGRVIHGAGANISENEWRFGIQMSYCLGQLTPEEAHIVSVPWERAQKFPARVQHMLGYYSHRTFLPDWPILWTNDYRDVRETLDPPAKEEYVSAGAKMLQPFGVAAE